MMCRSFQHKHSRRAIPESYWTAPPAQIPRLRDAPTALSRRGAAPFNAKLIRLLIIMREVDHNAQSAMSEFVVCHLAPLPMVRHMTAAQERTSSQWILLAHIVGISVHLRCPRGCSGSAEAAATSAVHEAVKLADVAAEVPEIVETHDALQIYAVHLVQLVRVDAPAAAAAADRSSGGAIRVHWRPACGWWPRSQDKMLVTGLQTHPRSGRV